MSQKLIDAIYGTMKQDAEFMALFGLTPSSPSAAVVERLVKGMESDNPITAKTAPQVLIYLPPGRYGRNHLVYEGKFCLDFYGKTSFHARQAGERAQKIFHNEYIAGTGLISFRCYLCYDADFATGITGVKGYKMIFDVDYVRN